MKKISLTLMFVLAFAASSMAKSIVFKLSNGTEVYYMLGGEKNPVMRFEDGKVVVNADSYEISSIKSFRFSETDDPNGIEQVLDKPDATFRNNQFVVKSDAAKTVKVYSINGTPAKAAIATADGYTTIGLSELPSGVYIIYIGDSSFKVMKK